jgi:hypothetical protein
LLNKLTAMLDAALLLVEALQAGDAPLALRRSEKTARAIEDLTRILDHQVRRQQQRELRQAKRRLERMQRRVEPG